MFSILAWNIRQGGGTRVRRILDAIRTEPPDVLVFSEFRNNDRGLELRTGLLRDGYNFQVVANAKADVNSVLIASRHPCGSALFPAADEHYSHGLVRADFEAFRIYGLYFPHKKKHRLFDFLSQELDDNEPSIVTGDWNTGKNGIDQKGNSFWYSEHLTALEDRGYVDAFRLQHGDRKEYSWYSHQGNGFRYDHTYIHPALLPIVGGCEYRHEWREQKLSDHSPMILNLKPV